MSFTDKIIAAVFIHKISKTNFSLHIIGKEKYFKKNLKKVEKSVDKSFLMW